MADLRDFVHKRRSKIAEELGPLRHESLALAEKINLLEAELKELDQVARTIGMVNGLDKAAPQRKSPKSELTIKQAALAVLADYPEGLTALDILREINSRYRFDLVRSSLSPQLSRLRHQGKIDLRGNVWRLSQLHLRGT
jgi:hypothetical protein